jgi:hypothetical protein
MVLGSLKEVFTKLRNRLCCHGQRRARLRTAREHGKLTQVEGKADEQQENHKGEKATVFFAHEFNANA